MSKLAELEKNMVDSLKKEFPVLKVGQTVQVYYKIREKDKERVHAISGIIIKIQSAMHRKSFTLRRISYGEGLEITFPLYSPSLEKIEIVQEPKRRARKSRLYYLRKRIGKKALTV